MSLVDELIIAAKAGSGGDGVVRWLHVKGKEYSGPSGGNGGDGGDIYIRAVPDVNLLARYRGSKIFEAGSGGAGENRNKHGRRGDDFIVDLPVGSLVRNMDTREEYELLTPGDMKLVLKGGRGGAGNAVFKSSVNRTPKQSTPGAKGEEATLMIELRLIADAGLVGLPNAGKTSLLNALTGAAGKVAPYAFTTLDPNLGALYGLIVADIPGLIEGASTGKGLGFKFLRHISRTRMLLHCVSLESENPTADYEVVRRELSEFEGGVLAKKPEIIVLTKSDTREPKDIQKIKKLFEKGKSGVEVVSVLDDAEVKRLQDTLVATLR
ncbi:Obg family GTPase CgtA [Candidatus Adlerbacteria bacterium RIFCSPLOWO2_01_FULL_51_16]|uniref:GTPase Obg n=1 Tax=Candidatus Adlerbacteria bacterium RIFCSPLOWO2_01_FULL_51_16 TaxID=1797243 RepID=A0A1F4XHB8_9BACT|nr:MAG: Obg family GTPase CgtA [Candidatus Adlerbacteria bacterium RIFCSPLOWO2_01_FULL_51_16]